jgi:hypothetical protein
MASEAPPQYDPLPIVADEGFPQCFRLALGSGIYRVTLYANVSESTVEDAPPDHPLHLPREDAYLVMRVDRESGSPQPETIFQRKLVPKLDYEAHELLFRFDEMVIAVNNLNGAGPHGSSVKGGVALAWDSSSGTR